MTCFTNSHCRRVRSHNSTHAARAVAAIPASGGAVSAHRSAVAYFRGTLQADDRRSAAWQIGIWRGTGRGERHSEHRLHRHGGEDFEKVPGWAAGFADAGPAAL